MLHCHVSVGTTLWLTTYIYYKCMHIRMYMWHWFFAKAYVLVTKWYMYSWFDIAIILTFVPFKYPRFLTWVTIDMVMQYMSCLMMHYIESYKLWIIYVASVMYYYDKCIASLLISATRGSNTTVLFAREYGQQASYVVTVSAWSLKIFNATELRTHSVCI